MNNGKPVFDAHVHVQPWEMFRPGALEKMKAGRADLDRVRACMESPSEFLKYLDEQGVEKAVLVNYVSEIMGFTDKVNEWVVKYASAAPERLIPVGSLDPITVKDPDGETEKLFHEVGIRALKIHPSHQLVAPNGYADGTCPALQMIYEVAEKAQRPVMFHTGTSIFPGARNKFSGPMLVEDVAIDFPKLKIVLCHAGRPLWMNEAVFLARRFPHVYLDVSSIPPAALLDYLPRLEEIAGKVLWGTDWPAPGVPTLAENVAAFRALPIRDEAKERILRTNAEKVFGEKAPAAK
ncbi:MAG TPA: amidohydrolase family protein [Planctomycetota bacterium]|nr:amidohydrolase family protein [Planctomycetota bacterium]